MAKKYFNDQDPIELKNSFIYQDDSVLTPPTLTADVDDYNPAGFQEGGDGDVLVSILRVSSNGGTDDIRGLKAPNPAKRVVVIFQNVGTSGTVQLTNNAGTSQPANRFMNNANVNIAPNEGAAVVYDTTDLRWRQLSDYK